MCGCVYSEQKPKELFDEDTSMATEDLLINNGCNRQTVEAVSEGLPQLYVVSPLTCGRKPQLLGHNLILRSIKISIAVPVASRYKHAILHNPGSE